MYQITNQILKKMNKYYFFICENKKKEMTRIQKLLKLSKIPKTLFDSFDGKIGDEKVIYLDDKEIYFIGYGKGKACDMNSLYKIYGKIGKSLYTERKKKEKIWIECVGNKEIEVENHIVNFILGNYKFDKYVENKLEDNKRRSVYYFYHPKKKMKKRMEESIEMGIKQNESRDFINEPANILNTEVYVREMRKKLEKNIKMKVYNGKELKKKGLNLILAVNSGSMNDAKFVLLEYVSDKKYRNKESICLVGKGVMFDSGGYSIKMGDFSDMKEDMAGSAIMYNVMNLISKFKYKGRYVGLLPLVENMLDAKSTRPGDIVTSYSGKTVEIIDTDAEGRLILADAMSYSKNYHPKVIIDIATLTGAAAHMFGNKATALMTNNNHMAVEMKRIGEEVHEHVWDLPMWEEYISLTKSDVADVKNLTYSTHAGAIMAGAFLYNFIPNSEISWVHLDNAGVDFLKSETMDRYSGATAEGFRMVIHFVEWLSKKM
jgi:leucyl aminopeptidase